MREGISRAIYEFVMRFISYSVEFGARAEVGCGGGENGGGHLHGGGEPAEDDGVLLFTLLSPSAMNHVQLVLLDATGKRSNRIRIGFSLCSKKMD